ncbi:MAG: LysM peptidoglycan-binding domain-containing protein, partial [Deltaproteobacteria bacterium]|nr:LysM peptidoglycan-binding domain-containing protein [Deltaproteobacteria bacterium]
LNPELRYRIIPKDNYPLRVPPDKGQMLLAKLDEIPVSRLPQRAYVYHRIRPGESLSTISRRYRCSIRSIMHANNLRRSSFIVAGKKLKIPRRGTIVYRSKKYNGIVDRVVVILFGLLPKDTVPQPKRYKNSIICLQRISTSVKF